jgi:hypothetical protein
MASRACGRGPRWASAATAAGRRAALGRCRPPAQRHPLAGQGNQLRLGRRPHLQVAAIPAPQDGSLPTRTVGGTPRPRKPLPASKEKPGEDGPSVVGFGWGLVTDHRSGGDSEVE